MNARETLRITAPAYNFTPEAWHYALAELTSAMTVIGLFRTATFEPGLFSEVMVIRGEDARMGAVKFMRQVAKARGRPVTLKDDRKTRDRDVWERWAPRIVAIPSVKQLAPVEPKVDGRSSPEGKQRMRTAQKTRWKREQSSGVKRHKPGGWLTGCKAGKSGDEKLL